jgi:chemotaxis protein CheY-P-specific phosphatase CheC
MTINPAHKQHSELVNLAFDDGYANAAVAFSMFDKTEAKFTSLQIGTYPVEGGGFDMIDRFGKSAPCTMVATEVFGDLMGKSYFVLDEAEFDWLTKVVKAKDDETLKLMRKEFLKELDNIISAAVITKLSNELKLKIYGDVPILYSPMVEKLENLIRADFAESQAVYVNAGYFSFPNQPEIKPLFVWVMDRKILV